MSIGSVSSQAAVKTTADKTVNEKKTVDTSNKNTKTESPAYVYEKSKKDQVVDRAQVEKLLKESNDQTAAFQKLISSVFMKQADKSNAAWGGQSLSNFFENLKVDDATRAQAQKDIAEDGYYGVKQTSERLLSFAKAVAGNDPAKLEEMRGAFQKGFNEATKAWGKKLPQISQDTYDAVMKGFDDWSNKEIE